MPRAPFDTIASIYDDQFTDTRTGYLQRQLVYLHLEKILKQNKPKRILELNCGTGADAIWLTQKGFEVVATDISADMVKVAKEKASELPADVKSRLSFKTLAAQEIDQLLSEDPFDLIFSNFGGLNCLSPKELQELTTTMKRLLTKNGRLVLVLMSRFCWWETLYFTAKLNWQKAWRRRSKLPIEAPLAEGITAKTWYYGPKTLSKVLTSEFKPKLQRPIGFFLPPSYIDPAFERIPKALDALWYLEKKISKSDWSAAMADHFLMEFEVD